jgi:outer membrane protein
VVEKHGRLCRFFLAATIALSFVAGVHADQGPPQPPQPPRPPQPGKPPREAAGGMHYRIGAGTGARPDYEGSNDYDPFPFGALRIWWDDGRYSEMSGAQSSGSAVRLTGNIIPNFPLEIGPTLQYRLARDNVQSGRVDALGEVDPAWEAGFTAAYRPREQPWSLEITWVHDISDEYDGHVLELGAGYEKEISPNLGIRLGVASTYASDDYMDTYFGVSAADAAVIPGYSTHNPDEGFKDVGGRMAMSWAGDNWGGWKVVAVFSYFRLLDEAADSSVVDESGDENQFFGGLMGTYER